MRRKRPAEGEQIPGGRDKNTNHSAPQKHSSHHGLASRKHFGGATPMSAGDARPPRRSTFTAAHLALRRFRHPRSALLRGRLVLLFSRSSQPREPCRAKHRAEEHPVRDDEPAPAKYHSRPGPKHACGGTQKWPIDRRVPIFICTQHQLDCDAHAPIERRNTPSDWFRSTYTSLHRVRNAAEVEVEIESYSGACNPQHPKHG